VAQVVVALLSALLTIIMMTAPLANLSFKSHGGHMGTKLLFLVFVLTTYPTVQLCKALGIQQGQTWLWVLAVAVNTVLGVAAGTLIGCALSLVFRQEQRKKPLDHHEKA
jgi:hypothetical protein